MKKVTASLLEDRFRKFTKPEFKAPASHQTSETIRQMDVVNSVCRTARGMGLAVGKINMDGIGSGVTREWGHWSGQRIGLTFTHNVIDCVLPNVEFRRAEQAAEVALLVNDGGLKTFNLVVGVQRGDGLITPVYFYNGNTLLITMVQTPKGISDTQTAYIDALRPDIVRARIDPEGDARYF